VVSSCNYNCSDSVVLIVLPFQNKLQHISGILKHKRNDPGHNQACRPTHELGTIAWDDRAIKGEIYGSQLTGQEETISQRS
jgi:hypothetical protein